MSIKCLYKFSSFTEFAKFTEFIDLIDWKIEKQLLKERVLKYQTLEQYSQFKKRFIDNKISIFDLKEEEIITWFDTSLLMRRILFLSFKKGINIENLAIIMEYPVIFGNHMRADFLLVYERLIVVLEFGMFNQDERRSEERYTKKLQESISYRQTIANIAPNEIKVVNYVLIYKPEYNRLTQFKLKDNILYNDSEVNKLVSFLSSMINKEEDLKAINFIENISNYY